jgi:hypothetical protein
MHRLRCGKILHGADWVWGADEHCRFLASERRRDDKNRAGEGVDEEQGQMNKHYGF